MGRIPRVEGGHAVVLDVLAESVLLCESESAPTDVWFNRTSTVTGRPMTGKSCTAFRVSDDRVSSTGVLSIPRIESCDINQ